MTAESIDKAVDKCLNKLVSSGKIQSVIIDSLTKQNDSVEKLSQEQIVANVAASIFTLSSELLRSVLKELL